MSKDKNDDKEKDEEKSYNPNNINDFKDRVAAIKGKQDPSSIQGMMREKPPAVVLPIGKRISNFFYVNKFNLIIGLCVGVAFIWFASSFIPKDGNYDLNTVFLTQLPINANDYILNPLTNFANDRNDDGEKNIEIEFLQNSAGDPAYSHTGVSANDLATAKFISIFQDYSSPLLFVDEANYNYLKSEYNMKFTNLSTLTDNKINDDKISLSETQLYNDFTVSKEAFKDLYVVIIDVNALGEKYTTDTNYMIKYDNATDYLKKLVG